MFILINIIIDVVVLAEWVYRQNDILFPRRM